MASAVRRQIIGGAPIIENRQQRPQIDGGGAAWPVQGSTSE